MAQASTKAKQLIEDNEVVVFSKSYCGFCAATKKLLNSLDVDYKVLELDNISDGEDLQDALYGINGQRSVPNVYIHQKHIGGNSHVQDLNKQGKLKGLLQEAGAIKA